MASAPPSRQQWRPLQTVLEGIERDIWTERRRLDRLHLDILELEVVYADWAPTASWPVTSYAAVVLARATARELAETRIEDIVEQALAADICECLATGRTPEPARLASTLWWWAVGRRARHAPVAPG